MVAAVYINEVQHRRSLVTYNSSAAAAASNSPPMPSAASSSSIPPGESDAGAEEADAWELEKEKCSFCRSFLKSPCKLQFKNWSICVDDAKAKDADFVSACSEFTHALIECTSSNSEFFAELNKGDDEEEGEDIETEESSSEAAQEENGSDERLKEKDPEKEKQVQ